MPRICVIGGGISGLTAAFALDRRGAEVSLIEAEERLGGKIRTERFDGFVVDAGPDSFLSSKPSAIRLSEQLGIADDLVDTRGDGGGTFILRDGRLQPLPEGITLLVPAEFRAIARTRLLSPIGKARMALDYVIPPRRGDDDESVGAFVRRRLGREAFERMAEPLLSGIYAGDADALSIASTFPRLREVELRDGGMLRGAIAQRRAARASSVHTSTRTPFVSFAAGLDELVRGFQRSFERVDIRTGTSVISIEPEAGLWAVELMDGSWLSVDGVVLAAPSHTAAGIVEPAAPRLSELLREIPWVSTATVSMAFDDEKLPCRPLGRGFVVPRAERRTVTAVTWSSNKFAGRSPKGTSLLRGFVGRAGDEGPAGLPDDDLVSVVQRDLRAILGLSADPIFARVFRWPHGSPQYVLGHPERLRRIDTALQDLPGLVLTGASFRGVGIPDCIANATMQSNALLDTIGFSGD